MRRRISRGSVRRVGIGKFEFERELVRRGLIERRKRREGRDESIESRIRLIANDRLL